MASNQTTLPNVSENEWLKLPVLAIAAAALAMALIDLLRKSPEPTQPAAQKEEFEDGI